MCNKADFTRNKYNSDCRMIFSAHMLLIKKASPIMSHESIPPPNCSRYDAEYSGLDRKANKARDRREKLTISTHASHVTPMKAHKKRKIERWVPFVWRWKTHVKHRPRGLTSSPTRSFGIVFHRRTRPSLFDFGTSFINTRSRRAKIPEL